MVEFSLDLVREIMSILSVKPLLRFKSISKEIRNLIDSPDFVNDHLKRSMETKTHRRLILKETNNNLYEADFDDGLKEVTKLYIKSNSLESLQIFGSCNGLLLLYGYKEYTTGLHDYRVLALWNPFTRQCKILTSPVGLPSNYITFDYYSFGLGYDSTTDDYKVVILYETSSCCDTIIWVFSSKSNSWRNLPNLPFTWEELSFEEERGYFANGALNWSLSEKRRYGGGGIAVFDLASESFRRVRDPRSEVRMSISDTNVVDGFLYRTVYYPSRAEDDVFRLKKHGDEFIWTKICTYVRYQLPIHFGGPVPLEYCEESNKILLNYDGNIIWYDCKEKRREVVEILGQPSPCTSIVCWESLVSLGKAEDYIKFKKRKTEKN